MVNSRTLSSQAGSRAVLAYYRVYSLDPENAHIIDVRHFEADGDAAAITKVGNGILGVSRELWNRERKVMDFTQ
jgi:hypothetical protein